MATAKKATPAKGYKAVTVFETEDGVLHNSESKAEAAAKVIASSKTVDKLMKHISKIRDLFRKSYQATINHYEIEDGVEDETIEEVVEYVAKGIAIDKELMKQLTVLLKPIRDSQNKA